MHKLHQAPAAETDASKTLSRAIHGPRVYRNFRARTSKFRLLVGRRGSRQIVPGTKTPRPRPARTRRPRCRASRAARRGGARGSPDDDPGEPAGHHAGRGS